MLGDDSRLFPYIARGGNRKIIINCEFHYIVIIRLISIDLLIVVNMNLQHTLPNEKVKL